MKRARDALLLAAVIGLLAGDTDARPRPRGFRSGWFGGNAAFVNSQSLDFDGTNDYVTAVESAALRSLSGMTIVGWLKADTMAVNETIVSKWGNAPANNTFVVQTDSTNADEMRVFIASSPTDVGSNYGTTTNANIASARWTFFAVRFDGTQATNAAKLRVWRGDTTQGLTEVSMTYAGTIPATTSAGTYAVEIGRAGALGRYFGPGNLDEIGIYTTALATETITAIYNLGCPADLARQSGVSLEAWWRVEGSTYPTIVDSAGNSHTGTMTNMQVDDLLYDEPCGGNIEPTAIDLITALDAGPDTAQCPAPTDTSSPPAGTLFFCDCGTGSDAACVAGSDANPGTAASPKQTYAAARAYFDGTGTTQHVALCRGGVWDLTAGQRFRGNNLCTSGTPCVWKDYVAPGWGTAGMAAPTLLRTDGTAAYTMEMDPGSNPFDNQVFANFAVASTGTPPPLAAIFLYSNIQNVEFRCVDISGHGQGFSLSGNSSSSGLLIADSTIHDNTTGNGITGSIFDDLVITRNYFHDNGDGATEHNVYINQGSFAGTRTNTVLSKNISTRSSRVAGKCDGPSMTVHNSIFNGMLIEGNLIYEDAAEVNATCWGLAVDAAGGNTEEHHDPVIRGNVVINVGNVGIGLASTEGAIVENNVVIHEVTGYSATAISAGCRTTSSPDLDNTNTTVRNNTVYVGPGASLVGVYLGERGTSHVSTNNLVWADSTAGTVTCYSYDLASSAYTLVDANLGYQCDTLESGTTGMDTNILTSNPLMLTPRTDPQIHYGSPAKNSGNTTSAASTDFLGATRDSAPDRGAFEVP